MKLNTNEKGDIILEDIYSGVELKTKDGESIKICMRDSGFEFNYMGIDYEAQKGVIRKRQDINAGETYTATLLMPDTIDANGNSYTKDFELAYCSQCIQMTNHLNRVCQKCKK